MPIAFFDLDGCLFDDRHRRHLIKPSGKNRWDDYHSALYLDRPTEDGLARVRAMHDGGARIVIVTGRPEKYQRATLDMLAHHYPEIANATVLMRPDGDRSAAPQLKVGLVRSLYGTGVDGWFFDDRDDILEAIGAEFSGLTTVKMSVDDAVESQNVATDHGDAIVRCARLFQQRDSACRSSRSVVATALATMGQYAPKTAADHATFALVNAAFGKFAAFCLSGMRDFYRMEDCMGYLVRAADLVGADFDSGAAQALATKYGGMQEVFDSIDAIISGRRDKYGRNEMIEGKVTALLFPDGIKVEDERTAYLWHLTQYIITKFVRLYGSGLSHHDSIMDAIVFSAIVIEAGE